MSCYRNFKISVLTFMFIIPYMNSTDERKEKPTYQGEYLLHGYPT